MKISIDQIARIMNTSPMRPDVTRQEVSSFVNTMKRYPLGTITIDLSHLPLVVDLLKNTCINACAVVSYPLAGLPTSLKIEQVKWAVTKGTDELEIPIDLYAFKSGNYDAVREEIETVLEAAKDKIVRIIPMTAKLTPQEIKLASKIVKEAGANYLKTNGGFGNITTIDHVKIIREEVGDSLRVMAAGGIRNAEIAFAMLDAGADMIATSSALDVFNTLEEAQTKLGEQEIERLARTISTSMKEVSARKEVRSQCN